jgi:heme-degrading monooxygenase HmoA
MIIRVFRAKVVPGAEEKLARKLRTASVDVLKGREGVLAYFAGRPTSVTPDEFVMISLWRDVDAVRAFAGDDWGNAVMPDDEYAPLLETAFMHHYEVIAHGIGKDCFPP